MSAEENLMTMRRYFDALFSKDLSPLLDLLSEDVEWSVIATGDTLRGKTEVARLAENHWAASPDRLKRLVSLFATEEYACLEYVTGGTLTRRADFPSAVFEATGRRYEFPCCFVFHFRDGKVDRVREYFDMATVKRQLEGGTEAPPKIA